MKRTRLSIRDKLKDFKLSYDTKELRKCLESCTAEESGLSSSNKHLWLDNSSKPKVISQIVEQVTSYYKIYGTPRVCLYYPGEVIINKQSINIANKVIISSIDENPCISVNSNSETIYLKNWTAYSFPEFSSSMLTIEFDNKKIMTTEPRKGHRQKKKIKNLDDRFIIVIDYIISSEDMQNSLKTTFDKIQKNNPQQLNNMMSKTITDSINQL